MRILNNIAAKPGFRSGATAHLPLQGYVAWATIASLPARHAGMEAATIAFVFHRHKQAPGYLVERE
jgi:hypothetical protein